MLAPAFLRFLRHRRPVSVLMSLAIRSMGERIICCMSTAIMQMVIAMMDTISAVTMIWSRSSSCPPEGQRA